MPSPFVVPNGIDLLPRPDITRHDDMLLFLGRVSWKKGLEHVIEMLPRLPGVRFVVAGNDDEGLWAYVARVGARVGDHLALLVREQRAAALAKAAEVRKARAELKEKLKMGSLNLAELFDLGDRDDVVGKTKVVAVLESLPGLGKVKARRLMETVGNSSTRRIQGLGAQQRRRLLEELGKH